VLSVVAVRQRDGRWVVEAETTRAHERLCQVARAVNVPLVRHPTRRGARLVHVTGWAALRRALREAGVAVHEPRPADHDTPAGTAPADPTEGSITP
jgi:hypothetical protein